MKYVARHLKRAVDRILVHPCQSDRDRAGP